MRFSDKKICALLTGALSLIIEGSEPLMQFKKIGVTLLLLNALTAYALNLSSMLMVQSVGSLSLTLFGYVKVSGNNRAGLTVGRNHHNDFRYHRQCQTRDGPMAW